MRCIFPLPATLNSHHDCPRRNGAGIWRHLALSIISYLLSPVSDETRHIGTFQVRRRHDGGLWTRNTGSARKVLGCNGYIRPCLFFFPFCFCASSGSILPRRFVFVLGIASAWRYCGFEGASPPEQQHEGHIYCLFSLFFLNVFIFASGILKAMILWATRESVRSVPSSQYPVHQGG